ncbi:MAG: DNA polymerase/3'-5' exonuclease PolX [Candidatus Omnitrophica bacterium]|nr:DNA polymerase/3'-5' exonuclease PolX [Candidatus Omnitrophota bacterium]MCM8801865.1 DNA polymerase/3'-5' exonuclease PolX [Candidatus Omnitrophota bacterium]
MNKNQEIAEIFDKIADALEFKGEDSFRISAYRKASRILKEYPEDIEDIYKKGEIQKIPGIGKGMAEKIVEYLETGKIKKYYEVIEEIPEGLLQLLEIPNLGPKTLNLVYNKLGVKSLEDLERVIENGQLVKLFGMGEKKVENIKRGIELYKQGKERIPLGIALPIVEEIINELKKYTKKIEPAGSLRRMKETIGDIDILATGENNNEIIEKFVTLPFVKEVLAKGDTKASVIVKTNNLQVDLRVVPPDSFGAALQYFTGSKAHNIKLRGMAKDKGLKISEYGVFKGNKKIAGEKEEDIYKTLDLIWIPPEIREDRGEIEAALSNKLPSLVEESDIKGDLHVHSKYSDGVETIQEIAIKAKTFGYDYIGICDHSKTSKIAGGLDEEGLKRRNEEIDKINENIKEIRILKGMEVDILADGSLDYSDKILEQLDFVIASIHQGFKKNVTERIKKAIENPYVDIIAHPTGRLLSGREGYEVDIDEIIEYASKYNVALEINCYPDRLDLNDINILKGKAKNLKFALGTDAHNIGMLKYIKFGIGMARRGWLTKNEILNTYDWKEMPLRRKR